MYLIIVSILISFSSVLYSKEVRVQYDNYRYNISYDKESVVYSAQLVNLSLKKKECNEHLVEQFNLLMEKMLSEKLSDTLNSDSFKITIDNKDFYASKQSPRAVFFRDFDRFFKQIKTEEMVNCEGPKKKK
jgi:hypothetical protein